MRRWRKFKISFRSIMQKSRKPALGTISLFLSLVVTPILGLTCLMVETIRYQDVIEELTEISDISSLSTLAHYDEFLKDRFGLLATSQDDDISSIYSGYFNKNSKMIGKDFNLVSSDVEGAYSLSDIKVMKQQILEYCEICSAVEIALNGLGISDLFEQLMEAMNLDKITKFSDGLDSTAKLAKDLAELIKDIKTVVTMTGDNGSYTNAKKEYEAAYSTFDSSLQSYISALNNSTAEGDAIYQDESVVYAWNSFAVDDIYYTSPRTNYANKANNLASQVIELKGKVIDISKRAEGILEDLKKINEATKDDDTGASKYDYVLEVASVVSALTTYNTDSVYDKTCQESYGKLIAVRNKVNGITMKSYNHGSSSTNAGADYRYDVPGPIADIGQSFYATLTTLETYATGEKNDMSTGLMELVSSLCNIQGACNPQLNAVVGDPLNSPGFDPNDFSNAVGTVAIVGLVDAVRRFTMPESIVDVLLGIVELLGSIIALIAAITSWATVFLINIVRIVKTGVDGELGNAFLLCGYGAYNFPNRTNYKEEITFTGYDFKQEIFQNVLGGDPTNPTFSDNLAAMEDLLKVKTESPTKPSFMGAEVEYLLCGYQNELQNQCGAFYNVMMLRMLLDFIPILLDSEVKTEASGAGPYAWIIYILIIVAEPIFDTFILVNGGKEPLIKTDIYLTPSGAPKLAEDIISFCSMMENIKSLSDTAEELNSGKPKVPKADDADGKDLKLLNCTYTEHLWLLLFLSTDTDVLMNRIQNLVNYESVAYYEHHEKPFELANANTYIHANVKYTINPMFDFSSMTDSTIINKTISSDRYIGY